MTNSKLTVMLFVVLVLCFAVFILISSTEPSAVSKAIYQFEKDSVVEISIKAGNAETGFVKAGKWSMVKPSNYRIDEETVRFLAGKLENLEAIRIIEENARDFSKYGLDKPHITVNFKLSDGKIKKLLIGDETASKFQRYVKDSAGKTVYTITLTDAEAVKEGKSSEFRDRNFLTIDGNAITSISLDFNSKRELSIYEFEKGKWKFSEPCDVNTKNDAVKEVLKDIAELKIKDFIDEKPDNLDKYGLSIPVYTLEMKDREGKKQIIHFGNFDDKLKATYIRLDDQEAVYSISSDIFKPENIRMNDLLNETPLSIGIGMVEKVVIKDKGVVYEFKRDSSKPEDIFTHNGKQVNSDNFVALYVDLMALTSEGYDPGNKGGNPEMTVIFEIRNNKGSVKLDLSRRDARTYFLTLDGHPLPFYVSSQKIELVRRWIGRVTTA